MTLTGKELVKLLEQHGWKLDRIAGSHHIMKKGNAVLSVPVHGNKALAAGLLSAILRQAGLK